MWRTIFVILVLDYGVESQRIRGKSLVPIEKYPFVVSVQEKNHHKCNGVILTNKFVLTSGHCLDKHVNSYSVLAAADDLSATFEAKRIAVVHFRGHTVSDYDLGLMHLRDPLNFTEDIQPIKLPKSLEEPPDWGYLVGFGSYRMSKFKDRLRALKVNLDEKTTACDQENDLEFCVGPYSGSDRDVLPEDPNKGTGGDPAWVEKDKEDPWTEKEGINKRSMKPLEKSIQKLEDLGEGIMNEFTIGTPYVRDGVVYGFLTRKDGEIGVMTSISQFIKYIKSNVFDFTVDD